MKIQGVLSVEGINFHIDVDAPDDERNIYVTNVHPNCLVIPKERWRVDFLGLPETVVAALHKRGIYTLKVLTDEKWELAIDDLPEETALVIKEALAHFRKIALLFERVERYREPLGVGSASVSVEHTGARKSVVTLATDISVCGLSQPQEQALRGKGVTTLADLMKLGRSRLFMTRGFDEKAVERVELTLRKVRSELDR